MSDVEEIERLRAEVTKWQNRCLAAYFPLKEADEVSLVLSDAARWRYVRDHVRPGYDSIYPGWMFAIYWNKTQDGSIEEMVDAALVEETK